MNILGIDPGSRNCGYAIVQIENNSLKLLEAGLIKIHERILQYQILEFVEAGIDLFLCSSSCGNGKTTWAVKFLLSYFDKIWNGNGFLPRGKFIYVPDLLNEIKQNLQNPEVLERTENLLKTLDLVVWDDIAIRKLTSFEQSYLTAIIDYRQNNIKSNIFTSNILPKDLEANVGSRLASRLCSDEIVILKGQDMRRRKNIGNFTNFE